jgi:hypothetical protein
VLRNALGSIRNLERSLRSIRVGPRALFAAVSAVHGDLADARVSVCALGQSLVSFGADAGCCDELSGYVGASLADLEAATGCVVAGGKLSVSQRLALEPALAAAAVDLEAALPLCALLHRTAQGVAAAPAPVGLLHRCNAQGPVIVASLCLSAQAERGSLPVDLDSARMLLTLGVALVADRSPPGGLSISFDAGSPDAGSGESSGAERGRHRRPTTVVRAESTTGEVVRVAAVPVAGATLRCAHAAALGLGVQLEFDADRRGVCIYWPVS